LLPEAIWQRCHVHSDEPIQGAEIWSTLTRTVEDQQLMFGENGFCHDAAHSARPNKPQNFCDYVD
jgi:hypothetical protein